jgi:poly(A) polymerase
MTRIPDALANPIFGIISSVAADMGVRAFVIGGYVRDFFLGRSSEDIDIVVEGSGIDLALAVAEKIRSAEHHACHVSVFRNFGTAMLKYHGSEIEFVGARKESYRHESRKPIVEDGTLEDDQARRDFTINDMAFSLQKEDYGELVDPYGGVKDLSEGIIRTPLDPEVTYSDDPLRMLRAIRFATRLSTPGKPFRIVPESIEAMRKMKDRMTILSKERIAEELGKILVTVSPSMGFRLMDETGLLPYVLPELDALKGIEVIDGKGHKDIFDHTLHVVDNVSAEELECISKGELKNYTPTLDGKGWDEEVRTEPYVWLRWAALLHDVGKPKSKRFSADEGWTFHGHEVIGERMVPQIFQELKMPLNEKMKYVQKLVGLHHRPIALVDGDVTDSAVRRLIFDAGNELDDLMLLCNADITSKNPVKVAKLKKNFDLVRRKLSEVAEKDAIRNWKNPITGDYIMEVFGIGPSNVIGKIKEAVKNAIFDGKIGGSFEEADAFMRKTAEEYGLKPAAKDTK